MHTARVGADKQIDCPVEPSDCNLVELNAVRYTFPAREPVSSGYRCVKVAYAVGAASQTLRVLLYSPVSGIDPPSGDATYTETLLKNPPAGVEYTTYTDAIADGRVVQRGRKPWSHAARFADVPVFAARVVELGLRSRWMFREDTRFITVDEKGFDLVHNHIFGIRQVGSGVPMVSSAGYPLSELYRLREGWDEEKVARADRLERAFAHALRVHRAGYWAPKPDVLTVYTEHYRRWLVQRGVESSRTVVLGQAIEDAPFFRESDTATLGFIGRDFGPKGGAEAVEAFRLLRHHVPAARLLVVTDPASVPPELSGEENVEIVTGATREAVVNVYLPRLSVLLAPTRFDCGVPFVVIESLRAGVPVILSSSPWLDGRICAPGAPRASEPIQVADLARRLLEDPTQAKAARGHARALYERLLSLERWHVDLRAVYEWTISRARATTARKT
jgi:glycosyltransferase involved in cell wall biosynthesis